MDLSQKVMSAMCHAIKPSSLDEAIGFVNVAISRRQRLQTDSGPTPCSGLPITSSLGPTIPYEEYVILSIVFCVQYKERSLSLERVSDRASDMR